MRYSRFVICRRAHLVVMVLSYPGGFPMESGAASLGAPDKTDGSTPLRQPPGSTGRTYTQPSIPRKTFSGRRASPKKWPRLWPSATARTS
eukprot:scaffold1499_cov255-Pinguiococcus_pyrenoidosus.AAC.2